MSDMQKYYTAIRFSLTIFFIFLFIGEITSQTIVKVNPEVRKKLSKRNLSTVSSFDEPWMKFQTVTDSYFITPETDYSKIKQLLGDVPFESYKIPTYKIDGLTIDSLRNEQWNLKQIEWDENQISQANPLSVLVAIIDTGIDWMHEDLKNQLWKNADELNGKIFPDSTIYDSIDDDRNGLFDDLIGYNFLDNKKTNQPFDDQGHGTSVAGILAAQSNNEIGISGVAPNVKIMMLKAFDQTGNGTEIEIAKALLYAWYRKVDVVNMSFGINSVRSLLLEDILAAMEKDGILLVGSSGNDFGFDRHYPSAFQSVISVGASTVYNDYATFSSYGNSVDLLAPGVEVPTTVPGNEFALVSGTSAAAPHVSASVAILKGIDKNLTTGKARALLQETATKIRGKSFTSRTVSGILNLKNLIQKSKNNFSVGIVSPAIDSWWASESLYVSINTLSPNFKSWSLSYQKGLGGTDQWKEFASDTKSRAGEVSGYLLWSEIKGSFTSKDSVLSLRLSVENMNGTKIEDRRTIFRQRNPLTIDFIRIEQGSFAESNNIWVESKTNHPVKVTIELSNNGQTWSESSQSWRYLNFLKINVPSSGEYLATVILEDLTGNKIVRTKIFSIKNELNYAQYDSLNLTTIPNGALFSGSVDFNADGFDDLIVSKESPGNNYGKVYFYSGSNLTTPSDSISSIQVPVDVIKFNNKWYFLTVALGVTFLFESRDSISFPTKQVWNSPTNAVRYGTKLFIQNQSLHLIYRDNYDFYVGQFSGSFDNISVVKKLAYPLDYLDGVAKSKLVRYNNINDQQVYISDIYGNILVYSLKQPGDSTLVFGDALPLYNSNEYIEAGDLDGDGLDELLVLSTDLKTINYKYNETNPNRWNLRVYSHKSGKDSIIYEKWFTDFTDPRYSKNQIVLKDAGGEKYLLLGLTPHEYVMKWDDADKTFHTEAVLKNVSSWGALASVKTTSGNFDWILNGGKYLSAWNRLPKNQNEIEILSFTQISDSTGYFKINKPEENAYLYVKSSLTNNYILVSSHHSTDSISLNLKPNNYQTEYLLTNSDYPHPRIDGKNKKEIQTFGKGKYSASYENGVILIKSDNPILFDNNVQSLFRHKNLTPSTIVADESKKIIAVSFGTDAYGWFNIPKLLDINRREMIKQTDSVFIPILQNEIGKFYITHFEVKSEYQVTIYFNRNINQSSLSNLTIGVDPEYPLNYSFTSQLNSLTITNSNRPWGSVAKAITLEVGGIKDVQGNDINSPGNQIRIEMLGTSISQIVTYPSPYVIGNGKLLAFGNMIDKATIKIFDFNMRLMRVIKKESLSSILLFDGKSENGEYLSTGVYFYIAEDENGNRKTDKILIVR